MENSIDSKKHDLLELDEAQLEDFLKGKICFVMFGLAACGTCFTVENLIKNTLIPKYKDTDIVFGHVDIIYNPTVKSTYRLSFYPVCILFNDGIEVRRTIGVKHFRDKQIFDVLDAAISGKPIPEFKQANKSPSKDKQKHIEVNEKEQKKQETLKKLQDIKATLEKIRKSKENVKDIRSNKFQLQDN